MAFSNAILPNFAPYPEGGRALAGLNAIYEAQKNALANRYYGPTQEAAINYQNALTGAVPSQIDLREGQAQQAQQEAAKNAFMIKNPQYLNAEGYLYSRPIVGNVGGNNQTVTNNNRPSITGTPPETNSNDTYSGTAPSSTNSMVNSNPGTALTGGGSNAMIPSAPSTNPMVNASSNGQQLQTLGDYKISGMQAAAQAAMAKAQQDIKNNNAYGYQHATKDGQAAMEAQLIGAGMSPDEAQNEFAQGKSMNQILLDHGYDPANPPPLSYPNTDEDRKNINTRRAAVAQVNNLGSWVSDSLGPYSQTIHGYSPKQVIDAMNGMNRDDQINFLAARMIMPDLAGFRTQVAGLHAGKGMIQEVLNRTLAESRIFQGLVQPDIFTAAQNLATQKLTEASNAANDVFLKGGIGGTRNKNNESANTSGPEGKVQQIKNINGKEYHQVNGQWWPVLG